MLSLSPAEARELAALARKAGRRALADRLERAAEARRANPSATVAEAKEEYRRVHWGERGTYDVANIWAPNPVAGVPVDLGVLRRIDYETTKGGDPERTIYFHHFGKRGEKGDGEGCPVLAFNKGGLLILGGSYRVTERGIVG
jgi:hypothetical protein